jgi:hypothetical protein
MESKTNQASIRADGLPIKAQIKGGGVRMNHNQASGPVVRTRVKGGGVMFNHSQSR